MTTDQRPFPTHTNYIDKEVAEALHKLGEAVERAAKMLFDEFGIGPSPYGRGLSGATYHITHGQAFERACKLRDSLTEKLTQLNTLRSGAIRERTLAVCRALSDFDK